MATMTLLALSTKWNLKSHVTCLWGRVGCGVREGYFLPSLDSTQTFSLDTHYNTQNKYFWTGFHKWPNTLQWGSVRIPTWNLYAVTQHLLSRRNFKFLNSPRGFQRSLEERSYNFDSSNHLKTDYQSILPSSCSAFPLCTLLMLCHHLPSSQIFSQWGKFDPIH